jgi:hypothetical protein
MFESCGLHKITHAVTSFPYELVGHWCGFTEKYFFFVKADFSIEISKIC